MKLPFGLPALVFSAKSFLAATLALWIAFRIGLPNPYWAVVTVYVVSQPHAGAVLSKSVYRVCGTMAGAFMSILLVPPLVNSPALLSFAVALWLGLCVFLSAIDRSSRAYMFVLAGYSTCIIVFPSVSQPGEIFDIAVLRVQEITLGILCGSLLHGVLLPDSSGELLLRRLDAAIKDAARWSGGALADPGNVRLDSERRRLATDINDMHDLLLHSGYEGANVSFDKAVLRALLGQIERILPLSTAVDDRLAELARAGGPSPAVAVLLEDVQDWLEKSTQETDRSVLLAATRALQRRCRMQEPDVTLDMSWRDRLLLSLLARLADFLLVYGNALILRSALSDPPQGRIERARVRMLAAAARRTIDRDVVGAFGAALATALTLFVGCLLWIASGWEEGASGVMLAGVYFAIYATNSNPGLLLRNKFIGVALRLLLGMLYVLIVLPAIDGFPLLMLSLSPVLIVCGALLTVPRYSPLAFNFIIGVLGANIITDRFEPDFAGYLNSGLATLTGIYFALVMMNLTQFLWVDGAVWRTLKAGRLDIAHERYGTASAATAWRSRMMHRIALMTPRLARIEAETDRSTLDALRDMMTGLSLSQLAALRSRLAPEIASEANTILHSVASYFGQVARQHALAPPMSLLTAIDHSLDTVSRTPSPAVRRDATLALLSIRRNMFPAAHAG